MALAARTVLTPEGPMRDAEVVLDGERIAAVRPASGPVPDRVLCPGFVDLQNNGMLDADVASADPATWDRLDGLLLDQGTTSWCPTLVTAPLDRYPDRLASVSEAMARTGVRPRILGVHLEGPFLGGRPGAHPTEHLQPIDLEWLAALDPAPAVLTLAPELDRAPEAVAALVGRGTLVALGHSSADADQVAACVDAGARLVTHLFNGMAPLDHRRPGLLAAALADPRLTPSLIADLVHVHPLVLQAAMAAKGPGRWILVTDAVAWEHPEARVAGRDVQLVDGVPRLADGTIAGSALTMDRAVQHVVGACGVPLPEAVAAASTTPATLLGRTDRGRIARGCLADLVALGPALDVQSVWLGGEQVR